MCKLALGVYNGLKVIAHVCVADLDQVMIPCVYIHGRRLKNFARAVCLKSEGNKFRPRCAIPIVGFLSSLRVSSGDEILSNGALLCSVSEASLRRPGLSRGYGYLVPMR